jgi:hypothetical protein
MMRFLVLILCFIFAKSTLTAQVSIGSVLTDTSAILDLYATDKGLLVPRLTMAQRDLIFNPAKGLMIYNIDSDEIQINRGTSILPLWTGFQGSSSGNVQSITATGDLSTSSITFEAIDSLEITPPAGTYLVLFNGQFGLLESVPISTAQGVIDLNAAYDELMDVPSTAPHGPVLGNEETILPGVYDMPAAASIAGNLYLDGGGDTTSLFIFRAGGAFTTGAGTTVTLVNGARARNIYWIAEGALSQAANTIMKGTLISHNGAISAAASSNLEGRMFSTTGAITFGPGTAYIPLGDSYVDLGVLSTFVMFTNSGAVSNAEPSTITGDVGTNLGAISGFTSLNGNIYGPGAAPNPVNNTLVSFSVYVDDVMIPFSSRTMAINTSVISVQAIATVASGASVNIRWHVDTGGVTLGNRILSLIKAN